VVETDSLNFVSRGVLSQPEEINVLYPDAYCSKKHFPTECNYEIYEKDLLAIVRAFEEWWPNLDSAPEAITVHSYQKNLKIYDYEDVKSTSSSSVIIPVLL